MTILHFQKMYIKALKKQLNYNFPPQRRNPKNSGQNRKMIFFVTSFKAMGQNNGQPFPHILWNDVANNADKDGITILEKG